MNQELKKQRIELDELHKHAEIANEEMSVIKNDIKWILGAIEKIDGKLWWLISSVIFTTLIQIVLKK